MFDDNFKVLMMPLALGYLDLLATKSDELTARHSPLRINIMCDKYADALVLMFDIVVVPPLTVVAAGF